MRNAQAAPSRPHTEEIMKTQLCSYVLAGAVLAASSVAMAQTQLDGNLSKTVKTPIAINIGPSPTPTPLRGGITQPLTTNPPISVYTWVDTTFQAQDVAVGANGAIWAIAANGSVAKVAGSTLSRFAGGGGGVRIAVDPKGLPWVVNAANVLWYHDGTAWKSFGEPAIDVGVGANGKVWILGTDLGARYFNGTGFTKIDGGGTRISVDPQGNPWVVNANREIWRYTGSAWQYISTATGQDVSVGPDGTVYVVSMIAGQGGFQILRWDGSAAWIPEPAYGTAVGAGLSYHGYVVRSVASGLMALYR
jgi:hypothetical protein